MMPMISPDWPVRNTVLHLRSQICRVRQRRRHVARQLSTAVHPARQNGASCLPHVAAGASRASIIELSSTPSKVGLGLGLRLGAGYQRGMPPGVGASAASSVGLGSRRLYSTKKAVPSDQPDIPSSTSFDPPVSPTVPPLPTSATTSTSSDLSTPTSTSFSPSTSTTNVEDGVEVELHESPYTIPNALTLARILACPFLGYTIVNGNYVWATGILFTSGLTDWLDGWLARRYNSRSVLGSILDPAADKALMTTLVGTLTWAGLLPLPLAILIFGRDLGLSISAFYFRFISLPKPRTFKRYFDVSIPSAEVKPTQISKINTALQLLLMGLTTVSPLVGTSVSGLLTGLQWTVAGTTIWSGFSYIGRSGVNILKQPGKKL